MRKTIFLFIALTSVMIAVAGDDPSSDGFSRKGKWEVYGFGQAITIFNVFESDASILGGGIGGGYHVLEHLTINGDFAISAVRLDESGLFNWSGTTQNTSLYMGSISLDYNILKSRITPVVTVGAGVGAFGEESGALFSQTIGIGVRWDASDQLFVKAILGGGVWETTSDERDGWVSFGFSLALGYKF